MIAGRARIGGGMQTDHIEIELPDDKPEWEWVRGRALLAAEKFAPLEERDYDYPPMAPDIVVEVLSPRDRRIDVGAKRTDFLAAGTALVIIVDPRKRNVRTYEAGSLERTFTATETIASDAFPDLAIDLAAIFATVRPRPVRPTGKN